MFTRSHSAEPRSLEPRGANGVQPVVSAESTEKSVIGNDLRIIGQGLKIIGRGILQVDGDIEGDVQGAEVIVGEKGKVTGMVAGQQVVIHGNVYGAVCGKMVALRATSHVEGDVHHMALAIEQGAVFEGRSRRAASESDLNADRRTLKRSSGASPEGGNYLISHYEAVAGQSRSATAFGRPTQMTGRSAQARRAIALNPGAYSQASSLIPGGIGYGPSTFIVLTARALSCSGSRSPSAAKLRIMLASLSRAASTAGVLL